MDQIIREYLDKKTGGYIYSSTNVDIDMNTNMDTNTDTSVDTDADTDVDNIKIEYSDGFHILCLAEFLNNIQF